MRDTDADWTAIGASDPYFGVLTLDRFQRDMISDGDKAAFFESGAADINFVLQNTRPQEMCQALDFGCGVGRLSLALAAKFDTVVGVDVSQPMLSEARKNASEQER
jgi:2-polyprenyl-3-methyl-5-hydroxy-6-metoxy-1,4-benzoquinol methylase